MYPALALMESILSSFPKPLRPLALVKPVPDDVVRVAPNDAGDAAVRPLSLARSLGSKIQLVRC